MTTSQSTDTATTTCIRCGRTLRSEKSVADGMGRTCKARVRAAAEVVDLTQFRDARAAKNRAVELIEQAGVIPASRAGLFLAVSSDGTNTYLVDTDEGSCTCKGYVNAGHCFHLVAANLLDGTARKAA